MSGSATGTLPELKGQQRAASDPGQHVWLSASAGTGKTQVLAARVFRLLLRGTAPGAILALTFTKAGAAEMAARINARLAYWVRAKDEELVPDLAALGEPTTPERIAKARTLFADVLDAPGGGLRIQTIHSFCQTLLAAFPVEAGLAPGFRPLDAREEAVLQRATLAELLVDERAIGRTRTIDAVGALSLRLGEGGAEGFLVDCARRPGDMAALPAGEGAKAWLKRMLDVPERDVMEHLAECCGDDSFDLVGLRRIAAANRAWGAATGAKRADIVDTWLGADPSQRVELLGDLVAGLLTQKGEVPKTGLEKLVAADPDYETLSRSLGDCCGALLGLVARARFADLYGEALMAGRDYAAAYTHAKRRAGAVDFDDLIRAAVELLQTEGIGEWVRYKLDQDTEHVLIDEAQDTNLRQWQIVDALAGEFFAGVGTRGPRFRTLFTVGDYKQAIFGFQGTDPLNFRWAGGRFKRLADENLGDPYAPAYERGLPMAELSLTHSFRSTRPILEFVDAALGAIPEPGLGAPLEQHASEVKGPGAVELWPPVAAGGDPDDEESWVDDATREVAKRIARKLRGWLDDGLMLGSKGRALRPEDVMILVKRRGDLASLLVARLHAEGVPVAGIDRLRLNAPLAVQDLLATVRFVLQPDDDLALASLLVSPLLGWSQDDLLAAAAPRLNVSLWRHIRDRDDPRLTPLYAMLASADLVTPYRFLEELLSGPLDGRRKLLARLGEEARDPIEELLSAALAFEDSGTPSLQLFLDWFDRGDVDIVRDPSQPLDAARVMTAHGAKGLQAPVVILADACLDPANSPRATLRWLPEGPGGPELPMLRPRKEERSGPLADLVTATEQRELEEHWRLFYVAATRAEERLVVTGALGSRSNGVPPANSWYAASAAAMEALGVPVDDARVFVGRVPEPPVKPKARTVAPAATPTPLPQWARAPAPVDPRPPRPLAPSALGEDLVSDPPPSAAMRAAAERGRLLHALFERLPPVAAEQRRIAAERWLAGAGAVADADVRIEIAEAACRVIADPRCAALFGPEALAEAPIAAVVPGGAVVAGTVDRLLVTPERVLVVDYKTGRSAPASLDQIPAYHVRQMAAYVAALHVIFPDRAITAALLYTATPVLFELPDALVAANLPS